MTTAEPPRDPAEAPPFPSLEAMRAEHAGLLEALPPDGLDDAQVRKVNDFLARGAALGRLLDAPADRQVAQGLLNYWTATLYAESRLTRGGKHTPRPQVPSALLAAFDTATAAEVAGRAERAVEAMAPDVREAARRVLLRLVRLDAEGGRYAAGPARRDSLGEDDATRRAIDILAEAGAVRVGKGATDREDAISLSSEALTRQWATLARWLEGRRAFREAARFWAQSGRDRSALLGRPLLPEALAYNDRDALEDEFIRASTSDVVREGRIQNVAIAALATCLALAVGMASLAWKKSGAASRAAAEAVVAREAADEDSRKARESESKALAASRIAQERYEAALKEKQEAEAARAETLKLAETLLRERERSGQLARQLKDSQERLRAAFSESSRSWEAQAAKLRSLAGVAGNKQMKELLNGFVEKIGTAHDRQDSQVQDELRGLEQSLTQKSHLTEISPELWSKYEELSRTIRRQEEDVRPYRSRARPLRPGVSLGLEGSQSGGSLCCAVKGKDGEVSLLTLGFVLDGAGDRVIQPMAFDGGGPEDAVARLSRPADAAPGTAPDKRSVALAGILPGVEVQNVVPGLGPIVGVADEVGPGTAVVLVGRGSGMKRGKVLAIESDFIRIERISSVGDAGGPVLTQDGRLIGLLWGGSEDASLVVPIGPLLEKLEVELLPPPAQPGGAGATPARGGGPGGPPPG
ncbi:hypothetical protein OJF2_35610 [Aquisphaera giovannonii]|uniref:Novel STAND NTPase 1 domain-containing protein n=1 Tax=Aquisphaera giovannonii TaxID=406548 RepID=A0A5B9W325_9BACT|nr:hypothetical protein [Aquisphaera giovannonii]QEH35016.1 hypothetical protein OJF2_35610 [Aquisphaera giovannonii]